MKKGIDLSTFNDNVDFEKVKNSGIEFVLIRIGWIGNKQNHETDVRFEEYYEKAKNVGLKIGFYVYSYVESSSAMTNAINWVKNKIANKTYEYPIFLDIEDKQLNNISKTALTDLCIQFCNSFSNSGVYANKNWFTNKLDVTRLEQFKIWLALYNGQDTYTADFRVDIWQYTDNGTVDGINTKVDMNYCYTDVENTTNATNTIIGGDFDMVTWKNGSTDEPVYQDLDCTKKIGTIYPREYADCYGIIDGKYLVVYFITDSKGNVIARKAGFVKYNGGIK